MAVGQEYDPILGLSARFWRLIHRYGTLDFEDNGFNSGYSDLGRLGLLDHFKSLEKTLRYRFHKRHYGCQIWKVKGKVRSSTSESVQRRAVHDREFPH